LRAPTIRSQPIKNVALLAVKSSDFFKVDNSSSFCAQATTRRPPIYGAPRAAAPTPARPHARAQSGGESECVGDWGYSWCTEMVQPFSNDGVRDMFWPPAAFNLTSGLSRVRARTRASPLFQEKSPIFRQKSPVFLPKSPVFHHQKSLGVFEHANSRLRLRRFHTCACPVRARSLALVLHAFLGGE